MMKSLLKSGMLLLTAAAFLGAFTTTANAADRAGSHKKGLPEKLKPYDLNGDGKLSRDEMKAFLEANKPVKPPVKPKNPWDKDGDGKLSPEEIAAAKAAIRAKVIEELTKRFNALDADTDGSVTLAEFTAKAPAGAPELAIKAAFARLDADLSGGISLEEFLKACSGPVILPPPPPPPPPTEPPPPPPPTEPPPTGA